jgi:hypothetical protein
MAGLPKRKLAKTASNRLKKRAFFGTEEGAFFCAKQNP